MRRPDSRIDSLEDGLRRKCGRGRRIARSIGGEVRMQRKRAGEDHKSGQEDSKIRRMPFHVRKLTRYGRRASLESGVVMMHPNSKSSAQ